jgi:hypothetical protein
MPTERPKVPQLSRAQVQYLKENVPAFINWVELAGVEIGFTMHPWQKRIVEALIRKDVLKPDGTLTPFGKQVWEQKIAGKNATMVVIDDPIVKTIA